jgi:two-component system, NtrC family, response regulator AtoC
LHLLTLDDPPDEGPASVNLEELEAWAIREAVKRTGGNNTKAADMLGINRDTLIRKMKKYGINRKECE